MLQNLTEITVSAPAIAIEGLSFSYPDKPEVLRDIQLSVEPGDRLGVLGYNGCGKTTLFLLICGVLTPSQGSISLLGKAVVPNQFCSDVGLVFQNPDDQLFSATVWEDISFAPENMGLSPNEVELRVRAALQLTGTEALQHRAPHHLSGGEKRMVAIAGILAMHPQIVIYDEPSANLDMRARRRLIHFLQESQQTFLLASHDLEFALEVCNRVIILKDGQIVADGRPEVLMADAALMEASGLEVPHSLTPPHHFG